MEEYVIPDDYTLPSTDGSQVQAAESTHRWSTSNDTRDKIIGGVIGGIAVAAIVVAGGVAIRNVRRERERRNDAWNMGKGGYEPDHIFFDNRDYLNTEKMNSDWWYNDDDGGNWDAFDSKITKRKVESAKNIADFESRWNAFQDEKAARELRSRGEGRYAYF